MSAIPGQCRRFPRPQAGRGSRIGRRVDSFCRRSYLPFSRQEGGNLRDVSSNSPSDVCGLHGHEGLGVAGHHSWRVVLSGAIGGHTPPIQEPVDGAVDGAMGATDARNACPAQFWRVGLRLVSPPKLILGARTPSEALPNRSGGFFMRLRRKTRPWPVSR
jgi:hypothetical protein